MNSSPSPPPQPDPTAESVSPLSGAEKPTFSQSDMPTGAGPDQSVPTASVAIAVGSTLSGYKLVQKLGEGGMGAVFIAEDVALRRKVALKTMKPELAAKETAKQRFMREARAAARIEHDNIVPIFQVGEDRGVPFLAMALLKGESLGDHLKRAARPDVPFILKVGRDVAAGLAAAHKQGLVHRDIKPDNIWIEPLPEGEGIRAKILDFGLARPQSEEESLVTQEGAILGTPAYMSPEQARGLPVDHRADLFSLGVVLYQMTTGKRPFTGRDTMAILSSLALDTPTEPLTINPMLPPILSRLIMRLLEKDVEKRVQKANDVVDVFKRLQPESTVVVVASPQPAEPNPWADIDSSMTDAEAPAPPPAPLAASRPQPVKPIHREQTEVVKRGAASGKQESGKPKSKMPMFIGGAVMLAGAIVAVLLIFGNKKSVPPADTQNQQVKKEEPPPKRKAPSDVIPVPPAQVNFALVLEAKKIALPVSLELSRPFTVEAYVTKSGTSGYPILILNKFNLQSGPNWTYKLIGQKGGFAHTISAPADDTKQHHLACVFNGKEMHLFVDGSKKATKNIEDDLPKQTVSPFELGHAYRGQIDEIRISQVARYESDFVPQARFSPDKDTLALYHCDEGQGEELKDSSGNNRHVKIFAAQWVKADGLPGPPQTGLSTRLVFPDEKSQGVEVASLRLARQGPYTIEGYFTPSTERFNAFCTTGYASNALTVDVQTSKWMFVWETPNGIVAATSNLPIVKDRRVHVAGVLDGLKIRLYVDGRFENEANLTVAPTGAELTGFLIGRGFVGAIDNFRLSKTARYKADFTPATRFKPDSDTLALYHFDEGEGDKLTDSSGNNHHGKIVRAKWVKAESPLSKTSAIALHFEGNGRVVCPRFPLTREEPRTYEAVVRISKDTSGRLFGQFRKTQLRIGDKRELQFLVSSAEGDTRVAGKELPLDRDVHVAGVIDNGEARLYLDGQLVGQSKLKDASLGDGPNDLLEIGDLVFHGQIREVRFSKRARYDKEFIPTMRLETDADTLALYHCDDGQGELLTDSSGHNRHAKIVGAKWVKVAAEPAKIEKPQCLIIWLAGGPSQMDTFDPKPLAEGRSIFKPIDTSVPGLQFAETLPHLAKQAHHLAVIRTMTHRSGDHAAGSYLMHTGREYTETPGFPTLAALLGRELERPDWPRCIVVGRDGGRKADSPDLTGATAGFLGEEFDPINMQNVNRKFKVEDFAPSAKENAAVVHQNMLKALESSAEPKGTIERYGKATSLLIARRLLDRGIPVVEVSLGGWDTHNDALESIPRSTELLDQPFAALLADLESSGRLRNTLIVVMGEFGRSPVVSKTGGRDHFPRGFSVVLGGGLIKSGQVIGKTSDDGSKIIDRPVTVAELHATILAALKIDPTKTLPGPNGVKIPIGQRDAKPISELLPKGQHSKFTNALGMEFALIPKGHSWLGGGGGKPGDKEVVFNDDFYLGNYEVTQEEWEKVMGRNPSSLSRNGSLKESVTEIADADLNRFPVETVSWEDAQDFVKRLNERVKEDGWIYRLPTEAEWEYACRGGPIADPAVSAFDYYLGTPANGLLPTWANHNNNLQRSCKVGSYPPNLLGLHDMHGNVWEWCGDEAGLDPKGAARRVSRGGGWRSQPANCATTFRFYTSPLAFRNELVGLRLARVPAAATP